MPLAAPPPADIAISLKYRGIWPFAVHFMNSPTRCAAGKNVKPDAEVRRESRLSGYPLSPLLSGLSKKVGESP